MPDTWTEIASLPNPLEGLGLISYDGKMFAFGGDHAGTALHDDVLMYDPDLDTWTDVASQPWGASKPTQPIVVGDEIWIGEGNDSGTATRRRIHFYDPASNTWLGQSSEMENPTTHALGRGIWEMWNLNGRIFVRESFDFNVANGGNFWEYIPATDSWQPKTNDPDFRYGATSSVIAGKLHRGIGRTVGSTIDKSSIYDILTDTWQTFTPSQWGRVGQAAMPAPEENGVVHATGSETRNQNHDLWDGVTFDPGGAAAYPLADGGPALVECAGYIYGCGGNLFSGSTARCFRYDVFYGGENEGWGILT